MYFVYLFDIATLFVDPQAVRGHVEKFHGRGRSERAASPMMQFPQARTSKVMLNRVCVARRKCLEPASRATFRGLVSLAYVLSPSPISCESDVGRADHRRRTVVDASDRIEVVLQATMREGLDDQPSSVCRTRSLTCLPTPTGSPMSCRQSNMAMRSWFPSRKAAAGAGSNMTRSETPASLAAAFARSIEPDSRSRRPLKRDRLEPRECRKRPVSREPYHCRHLAKKTLWHCGQAVPSAEGERDR
jgi:hypothetical protein